MKYLNLTHTTEEFAWSLSSAIWGLTNPPSEGPTLFYTAPVLNGEGKPALPLTEQFYRIHPRADVDTLVNLINISEQERDAMRQALLNARGTCVSVEQLIPASWSSAIMTKAQAASAGFQIDEL